MNSKSSDKCAVLKDQSGNPVPLTGIDVRATIDDVLTRACITQTYENREELNIEAVYTFPLLLDAVLLDFTVRIDGKVRRGTVMKKSTARADYENAVEQGDSAAMLENTGDGLYSMSVGNLLAGQKIEISFSYAYPNVWNGRLLRFMLPTVNCRRVSSRSCSTDPATINWNTTIPTAPDMSSTAIIHSKV